jgi:hypothetical protein
MMGQNRFIGGNHMFTSPECPDYPGAGRLESTDEFDYHVYIFIIQDAVDVGGHAGRFDLSFFADTAHQRLGNRQAEAGALLDEFLLLIEKFNQSGADLSTAEQADVNLFHKLLQCLF